MQSKQQAESQKSDMLTFILLICKRNKGYSKFYCMCTCQQNQSSGRYAITKGYNKVIRINFKIVLYTLYI